MTLRQFTSGILLLALLSTSAGGDAISSTYSTEIRGMLFYDSDSPDVEDFPYTSGQLFAVQADRWQALRLALQKQYGMGAETAAANLQFSLNKEMYQRYFIAAALLDQRGIYRLSLKPDRYRFCAGNLGAKPPAQQMAIINGCSEEVKIVERRRQLNFHFGELGLSLAPSRQ